MSTSGHCAHVRYLYLASLFGLLCISRIYAYIFLFLLVGNHMKKGRQTFFADHGGNNVLECAQKGFCTCLVRVPVNSTLLTCRVEERKMRVHLRPKIRYKLSTSLSSTTPVQIHQLPFSFCISPPVSMTSTKVVSGTSGIWSVL